MLNPPTKRIHNNASHFHPVHKCALWVRRFFGTPVFGAVQLMGGVVFCEGVMPRTYRIKDWQKHYENNKSREREVCSWCPIPNKQDGLGYGRLLQAPDGAALYGAFLAVILVASKQGRPRDGYLTGTGRADDGPLSADDLSIMTKIPEPIISRMLETASCANIGWIEVYESGALEVPAKCPPSAPEVPVKRLPSATQVPLNRREEKEENILRKPRERNPMMDALAVCDGGPQGLTSTAWGRIAKAMKEIREASPDVDPSEITRRRANYFTHYPDAYCTSTALAAHWGLCANAKAKGNSNHDQPMRLPRPPLLTDAERTALIIARGG